MYLETVIGRLLVLVALSACQRVSYEDPGPSTPKRPTNDDGFAPTAGPTGTGAGDGTDTVASEEGFMPTGETAGSNCGPVDVLFVVDNSSSMATEQSNLIGSFPGFIAGIEQRLIDENDFHIGVVTTDDYAFNEEGCQTLGALVTRTEFETCGPFADGHRYMTGADDLAAVFPCAGRVGTNGWNNERTVEAALTTINGSLDGPDACNEGFVREDALLVLVIITDEDDIAKMEPGWDGSAGDPHDWFTAVVDQKGVESNAVVLAIAGRPPPNACINSSTVPAVRIAAFVTRFTYGVVSDVCEDDYGPIFDDALEIISLACEGFTPPG